MIPATCARQGCDADSAFRVEVLLPDAGGKYGVMVVGIAVCADHALDVQLEGAEPFLAGDKGKALAGLINRYQNCGAPVMEKASVRLVPLVGEDRKDAVG